MYDNSLHKRNIPMDPPKSPSWIAIGILLCFWPIGTVIGAVLLCKRLGNWNRKKQYDAYRNYETVIGERAYIRIADLARTVGKDQAVVRQELRNMIGGGYLGKKAYVDMSTGCLVIDPDARPQGRGTNRGEEQAQESVQKPVEEPVREAEKQPEETSAAPKHAQENVETMRSTDEFEKKLQEIKELNDRIEDAEVSRKIDRIGEVTASIFRFAKERPERRDEIRKFLNYYLPTTLKLLESYALLEKQSYQGENITAARRDIEKILDTLVKAFEQQQDKLFHADAMDISSDIQVLETMMAKDGLSEKKGLTLGGH